MQGGVQHADMQGAKYSNNNHLYVQNDHLSKNCGFIFSAVYNETHKEVKM
jgi:hypothetical protein